jgi:hypothetical protein
MVVSVCLSREDVTDLIAYASNLLQIRCFSASERDKVAYLQSFAADMQHIRLVT